MIRFRISPFLKSAKFSLELEDFEPQDGYERFLRTLCDYLNEQFLDWCQGIESGIGHITYCGYTLTVYWTDYPFSLSFDCQDETMAQELKTSLEAFFDTTEPNIAKGAS